MATYSEALAWRLQNPERHKEHQARYRAKNRARRNAQSREWNKANPKATRLASSQWSKRNRIYRNNKYHQRRAIMRLTNFEDCSEKIELLKLERFCRWCCVALTDENRTIDHIIPVARGGHHIPDNLTASCAKCNFSKSDRLVSEWLPEQEFAA